MTSTQRPAPPYDGAELFEGLEWQVVVDDDWSTAPELVDERQCRQRVGGDRCPNAAEAILWRPVYRTEHPKRPWAYCSAHLYGRWIEDGRVMSWRAVRAGS